MSALPLDRFYPIVDSAAWLARLLPIGVRFVQLRIKDRAPEEVRLEIRQALRLTSGSAAVLVINDHWQLAIEEGADFVHLGQEDLDGADVLAIRRHGLRLGISTHDHAELDRAVAINPTYVALGPIHPTRLKAMRWAPQWLARIREWKRLVGSTPLVAIGGLTVERAADVLAAGADTLSVVTDVIGHPHPERRVEAWLAAVGA